MRLFVIARARFDRIYSDSLRDKERIRLRYWQYFANLLVEVSMGFLLFDDLIICGVVDVLESFGRQVSDLVEQKFRLFVRIRHRIEAVLIIVLGAIEVDIIAISVK